MTRSTLLLAGAAAWAICASAGAATTPYSAFFEQNYDLASHPEWTFNDVVDGIPTIVSPPADAIVSPTHFLGEFGHNDVVHLNLDLPQHTAFVQIKFTAYLLRTWDGANVQFAGPDTFGYGIDGQPQPILSKTFSNGKGNQSFCPPPLVPDCFPGSGSDLTLKDKLGFKVILKPVPGIDSPAVGTPMSLVYHFDSLPIAYSGDKITFNFFSEGLQVLDPVKDGFPAVVDESFGLDNVVVTATTIPEPKLALVVLGGLALMAGARRRTRNRI